MQPFKILSPVAKTTEQVGGLSITNGMALHIRRVNHIQTIHGTLVIDGNTLGEAMITAILEGRRETAPSREIIKVRNAAREYDNLPDGDVSWQDDLLKAHQMLIKGLLDAAGQYRKGGVGVMGHTGVVHVAPPAGRVPELMADLLHWLHHTDLPTESIILACQQDYYDTLNPKYQPD